MIDESTTDTGSRKRCVVCGQPAWIPARKMEGAFLFVSPAEKMLMDYCGPECQRKHKAQLAAAKRGTK